MLPANIDGMVGETILAQEQAMYVRPKMVEINALIAAMNDRCIQDTDQAWDALKRLTAILNDELKLGVSVTPRGADAE